MFLLVVSRAMFPMGGCLTFIQKERSEYQILRNNNNNNKKKKKMERKRNKKKIWFYSTSKTKTDTKVYR